MAKPRMDLSAFVGKLLEEQDGDVLREGIRVLSQALMETEVAGLIGADRHERTPERTGTHLSKRQARRPQAALHGRIQRPGKKSRRSCPRSAISLAPSTAVGARSALSLRPDSSRLAMIGSA